MTIATYADLQTTIASWLGRDDLTSEIPDFITLFEAHAVRELRVRDTETTATLNPSSGTVALPADFLGMKALTWTGDPLRDLVYMTPSQLDAAYPTQPTADAINYTIKAGNIIVRPISDTALTIWYRAKTSAVSGALNWLFTNHPDAYLNGSLVEAYLRLRNVDQASLFEARRDKILNSIKSSDFSYRPVMQVRQDGVSP